MAVKHKLTIDYARESIGQRDQIETHVGTAAVKITATKVQLVDKGVVVLELDREDWSTVGRFARGIG